MGGQLGQLQFPVILLSKKDQYQCRHLVEGVLARVHAWQLRYSPPGHTCSSASCARSCPQRSHKPHRGIYLQSSHPGVCAGQSAEHLYDLERLASSPARGSNPEFGHFWTTGWNPGVLTVWTDRFSWTQPVPVQMKSPPTMKRCHIQKDQTQGIREDPLSAGFASCTQRGCSKGMPW